jgi:hypothetical protein
LSQNNIQKIPYGYCHCGCGQKTNLMPFNDKNRNFIKDEPFKFIRGHNVKFRGVINYSKGENHYL